MRSIDPVLLRKIKEQNQTIYNNAQPKMEVSVARAKSTVMDSTYWTVETIRQTTGLGDVSVAPRRFKSYGRPNRIYEIHVKDGEVITSIREYPDKLREGFKNQFSLGLGTSVAVAFNGEWERYRKFYRLVTEEKPWISWVDNNGYLWTQRWDETETRMQLSSNVVKVRMIRAWKNTAIHYLDQGIVAAYIKTDGKVYYRNFCIQEDYSEAWEYEKELTGFTGTAVNVNLFITNDYRMGFIIEDNTSKIHWLVTVRNWGGMASPAESIVTSIKDITFNITPIKYHDTFDNENITSSVAIEHFYVCPADVIPTIISTKRLIFSDKKTIQVEFNYNLECNLLKLKEVLLLQNTIGESFEIDNVEQNGKVLTITTTNEMPFSQDIILTYNEIESYYLAFRITETCLYYYPEAINLTIKGIPPISLTEENLLVGIKNVQFDVARVYYRNFYNGGENINAGPSDIVITVTKVGSNPL